MFDFASLQKKEYMVGVHFLGLLDLQTGKSLVGPLE